MEKICKKLILLLIFIISLFIWTPYILATTYQENIVKEEINTSVDKDETKGSINKEIKKTEEEILQQNDYTVIKKSIEINNTEK